MNRFVCSAKAAVPPAPAAARRGASHPPHLCVPGSWRLCEADPCSASTQTERKQRRTRQLHWLGAALAAIYALSIAVFCPGESPLLLLAVLPIPGVVDALIAAS